MLDKGSFIRARINASAMAKCMQWILTEVEGLWHAQAAAPSCEHSINMNTCKCLQQRGSVHCRMCGMHCSESCHYTQIMTNISFVLANGIICTRHSDWVELSWVEHLPQVGLLYSQRCYRFTLRHTQLQLKTALKQYTPLLTPYKRLIKIICCLFMSRFISA